MIRIKWSDIEKHQPIQLIVDLRDSKIYANDKYLLINASIEDSNNNFELSIPYWVLRKEIVKLPMSEQQLFTEGKVKMLLYKRDWGKCEIKKVEQA